MITETNKPIVLAGDWHGSIGQAAKVVDYAAEHEAEIIFQLGDFGIWYNDKPFLNKLQARLEEHKITLYFVDGNHEDFKRLYAKPIGEDGTRMVRENIFHLPRGHRFTLNGVKYLALGGAASIDRKFRVVDRSFWEEELITDEDVEKAIAGGPADVMLCHDSPTSAPNTVTDNVLGQMRAALAFGQDVMTLCAWNRNQLDRVVQAVKPEYLFHGHYHAHMMGVIESTGTKVTGLDEGVARLGKHTLLTSFSTV